MGTIGGNLLQATRCWYWRLKFPCRLHGGERCHAREGEHREHAIFANGFCASAHPSDPAAALLALGATLRTDRRELPVADLYRLPDDDDRDATTLAAGRADPRARRAGARRERLPQGDGPQRWSFALVGVAAARFGDEVRLALAGVAPVPWALDGRERARRRDAAAGHAYKVELARALVRRARRRGADVACRACCGSPRSRSSSCSRSPRAAATTGATTGTRRATEGPRTAARLHRASRARGSPAGRRWRRRPSRSTTDTTYRVELVTNCGDFTITLDQKTSPKTIASFVALARDGFFDDTSLPPDRPRLRDPGRRPDGDRHRRAGLHDGRPAAARPRSTRPARWRWPRPATSRPAPPAASSSS